ncbi:hypothetical protein [Streptomyces sp. NPDC001508]|uniref:hypothetical protein n=1 Tax=Streptomyces sp. NPDC001508 TaxID=3154656 RepID=UPI003321CA18
MSPMWDDREERDSGTCCACGIHTDDGIVRWLPRSSGPDVRLIVHARSEDCTPRESTPASPASPPPRQPLKTPSATARDARRSRSRALVHNWRTT